MDAPDPTRWLLAIRDLVQVAWQRVGPELEALGVSEDELAEAAVTRTLARFERAGRSASDTEFREAVERLALEDLAVVLAWEHGDASAWIIYSRDHRDAVRIAASRQGASPALAEELADELPGSLVISAQERGASPLARYDGSGSLQAWLCTIARRRVADAARRGSRQETLADDAREAEGQGPVLHAQRQELAERLHAIGSELRKDLTERELIAVLLKHEQGLAQRAIAARLGVSDSRVTRLIQHALDKIREKLPPDIDAQALLDRDLPQELMLGLSSSQSGGHVPGGPSDEDVREDHR